MEDWLRNLIGYLLAVSVMMQMIPNPGYEKYVRLFTGFLLILLVLNPILKIGAADELVQKRIEEFVQEQEMMEKQAGIQREEFERKIERRQETGEDEIVIHEVEQVKVEVLRDD